MALLRSHRDEQDEERLTAPQLWEDGDWLFAMPTGTPHRGCGVPSIV
ncbi:hypothetical protein ACGF5H_23980 [Micromonospora chalcea]